ncbi:hypothetical protein AAF712_014216 [Marasmius tenuissimus]|uniref:Glucose-methanol-choline oxidoreductase N-terminal domain-containing protein n=1 Tax=Marasmius tenuissimus TaxID=585030 RepID=A0ABR2ZBN2_9AGAR
MGWVCETDYLLGFVGQAFASPDLVWPFSTAPQTHVDGRSIFYPRGKMIGGSSGLNAMAWVRPPQVELDTWAKLGINGGWDWNGLLPYMMKVENVSLGDSSEYPGSAHPSGWDSTYNGRSGPIDISFNNAFTGVQKPFVESVLALGEQLNENPASGSNLGISNGAHAVDITTGNRSYAYNYYTSSPERNNLLVLTGAMVSRVILSQSGELHQATGVEYLHGDQVYVANASHEVVLSAGAVQTPQLLELSGIGNKTILNGLGIETAIDLPTVGENFQASDHNSVTTTFLLKEPAPITLDDLSNNATFFMEQQLQYLVNKTGFLTTLPTYSYHALQTFFSPDTITELVNVTRNEISQKGLSEFQKLQADLQLQWITEGKVGQIELAPYGAGLPGPNSLPAGRNFISIVPFGQHLFSRGSIHINTTSVLHPPVIDPNYLDYSFDKKVLSLGVELARRIAATAPLSDLIESEINPGTSESDIDAFVVANLGTEYNAIGTAALAPQELGGVVDENLIVYGTANLRVVDARFEHSRN